MGHVLILSILLKHPPSDKKRMTQTYLGKLTGIENSSLVIFLDELEKRNWVQRVAHPSDRRAYVVALTENGKKRYSTINQLIANEEQQMLSFMSQSQRGVFGEFLTELLKNLSRSPDVD